MVEVELSEAEVEADPLVVVDPDDPALLSVEEVALEVAVFSAPWRESVR